MRERNFLLTICLSYAAAAAQIGAPVGPGQGAVSTSARTGQVFLDQLPPATPEELAQHPPVPRPQNGWSDRAWSERACWAGRRSDLTQPTVSDAPATPIAAGPDYLFYVSRGAVSITDRNGQTRAGYPKSLAAMIGLPSDVRLFEPTVMFDIIHNRFIVMAERFDSSNSQWHTYVAVSRGSDPSDVWKVLHFQEACSVP